MTKTKIDLYAPLDGTTVDLKTIPDEVFASGAVGEGVSIAPTSCVLKAPCAGEVINIHSANHALSLRTADGINVLMHIGLDTVNLKGKGFHLKTAQGAKVQIGDPLIAFDFSFLEKNAKSMLTEIIVSSSDKDLQVSPVIGKKVTVGTDVILTVTATTKNKKLQENSASDTDEELTSWQIEITDPTGFHARPAAVLASGAKKFSATVKIVKNGKEADAKSITAIMGLNIKQGDLITLKAKGDDAAEALFELVPALELAMSKEAEKTALPTPATIPFAPLSSDPNILIGTPASEGKGLGKTHLFTPIFFAIEETASNPAAEVKKLEKALAAAAKDLQELSTKIPDKKQASIFTAHAELLADSALTAPAFALINSGKSAAFAWNKICTEEADRLTKLDNPILSARATDIRDINTRVLALLSDTKGKPFSYPDDTILIAEELTPSATASLDKTKIKGIATTFGSATSHSAILAKTLGIPAIAGIEKRALKISDGTLAFIDGSKGTLQINLSAKDFAAALKEEKQSKEKYAAALKNAFLPATTKDGKNIDIGGNVGSVFDAEKVLEAGGSGIGLLRSEFLFLNRQAAPSEEEQADAYIKIAKLLGKDKKLIIRTLDIGGDKPLSYLPMPAEANPFLGMRGIRLTLAHQDLFRTQIRAILAAAKYSDIHIMFPMISRYKELSEAKQIVLDEQKKLNAPKVKIGVMIEVPSAVLIADSLASEVDFFSIGTNDLTQYTLAMDRGNPDLNKIADGLHPAVLRLIKMTVAGAHKHKKFVGVCGDMAGKAETVPLLLGLGVDELSMAPPSIPIIKELVRKLDIKKCEQLANTAMELPSASAVHALLQSQETGVKK